MKEHDGRLCGYEFEWSENKAVLASKILVNFYPDSSFAVIHSGNYQKLIFD